MKENSRRSLKRAGRKSRLTTRKRPARRVAARKPPVSSARKTAPSAAANTTSPPTVISPPKLAAALSRLPCPVPPILLEGDEPSPLPTLPADRPVPSGAGNLNGEDLPGSYGTGRLLLTARDPACLYAHWDLTPEQLRDYNSAAEHRHLIVRVHLDSVQGAVIQELPVHPESRHWFIHVDRPGATCVAELGYYSVDHHWRTVSVSDPVTMPAAGAPSAPAATVTFATIPLEFPLPAVPSASTPSRTGSHRPKAPAPAPVPAGPRPSGFRHPAPVPARPPRSITPAPALLPERHGPIHTPTLPYPRPVEPTCPSVEKRKLLRKLAGWTEVRHEWIDSAGIEEVLQRGALAEQEDVSWLGAAELGLAPAAALGPGPEVHGISSPGGPEAPPARQFWFNVNAELTIYGATEPGATVTVAGRQIQLRPDGTFSLRVALPDGFHELPVVAKSFDGEKRGAALEFLRRTVYTSEPDADPQSPGLKPPSPKPTH